MTDFSAAVAITAAAAAAAADDDDDDDDADDDSHVSTMVMRRPLRVAVLGDSWMSLPLPRTYLTKEIYEMVIMH